MLISDWSSDVCSSDLIDLLVNNAGLGRFGAFVENPPEAEREMLAVTVVAVAEITRALLPGMLDRARASGRRAGLIGVSSTAAFTPFPFLATYPASTAFELKFIEAIAEELRERRSEKGRVGEEWVRTCRSRWEQYN